MATTLTKALTVSEFVTIVRTHLQTAVGRVIIQGEVSGFNIAKETLVFFELKDKSSRLTCFMRKWQLQTAIENGMEVKVTGYPSLFQNSGRFHVRVQSVEPVGEGALQRAFELLKKQLDKEGLFAPERKRLVPQFPDTIGLVTSPDAAAYTDVLRILNNRWGGLEIYLTPVGVQGQAAINQIVGAIRYQNEVVKPSVIILTRGGGSLEDLQAFNSEEVARAIFSSRIPVVCGVGHERDVTIADLVSDVRASTPSNAAERVVPDRGEILFQINTLTDHTARSLIDRLYGLNQQIDESVRRIESVFLERIRRFRDLAASFQKHFWLYHQQLAHYQSDITNSVGRMIAGLNSALRQRADGLASLKKILRSLSPERVLARGYSMTISSDGAIVKSSDQVTINDQITTRLAKGKIDSKITNKE